MADPFLDDCGGWTPAPDVLTKKYGFESAYLWGRLRRLCQLGKGTYTISPEALGKRFGMSRRTVIDRLKNMIRDGYIEDLTPGVRNKAHTYSTKKGEAKILAGVQISHTESDMLQDNNEVIEPEGIDVGMRNLHSDDAEIAHLDDDGMQKLPNRYAKNAHPGMQNLHLKRDSLETDLRDSLTPKGVVGKPPAGAKTIIRDRFLELTGLSMPTSKSDISFWWANFGEILKLARGNPDLACRWEGETVSYMQASHLTITGPKSIVGLIGALASGQTLQKNGAKSYGTHRQNNKQPTDRLATRDKSAHDAELEALANPRPHPG